MNTKEVTIGPGRAWPSCVLVIRKGDGTSKAYYPRKGLRPRVSGDDEFCARCDEYVKGCNFCPTCGLEVTR